jgi:hypothetical protein
MRDSAHYEIQVQGGLSDRWAGWFEGMIITTERAADRPPVTTLAGTLTDQAALLGLLHKLHDLSLIVVLIRREALSGAANSEH